MKTCENHKCQLVEIGVTPGWPPFRVQILGGASNLPSCPRHPRLLSAHSRCRCAPSPEMARLLWPPNHPSWHLLVRTSADSNSAHFSWAAACRNPCFTWTLINHPYYDTVRTKSRNSEQSPTFTATAFFSLKCGYGLPLVRSHFWNQKAHQIWPEKGVPIV